MEIGGSPQVQPAVSPQAENTSPKKRRKVMNGRWGQDASFPDSCNYFYPNHALTHTCKIAACVYCRRSVSYRCFSTTFPLPLPHDISPFFDFSGCVDGKTDCHDAPSPMTAYDLRMGKNSPIGYVPLRHWR